MNFKEIIKYFTDNKLTISTMESCTGGGVADAITSCEGASEVLFFSAVTYSNEYKIKMGVDEELINQYSVYSMEVAKDMSLKISDFTNSNVGVGITGKLNRVDKNNPYGEDNIVFISVYFKNSNSYYTSVVEATEKSRFLNKKLVINKVIELITNNIML